MDSPQPGASPPSIPDHEWEMRMKVVERLLIAFRLERVAYMTLCVIACVVLLTASIWLFAKGDRNTALAMFGSTGVLTFTLSRLLQMWNQALQLVAGGSPK